jgi:hypothetical protein
MDQLLQVHSSVNPFHGSMHGIHTCFSVLINPMNDSDTEPLSCHMRKQFGVLSGKHQFHPAYLLQLTGVISTSTTLSHVITTAGCLLGPAPPLWSAAAWCRCRLLADNGRKARLGSRRLAWPPVEQLAVQRPVGIRLHLAAALDVTAALLCLEPVVTCCADVFYLIRAASYSRQRLPGCLVFY